MKHDSIVGLMVKSAAVIGLALVVSAYNSKEPESLGMAGNGKAVFEQPFGEPQTQEACSDKAVSKLDGWDSVNQKKPVKRRTVMPGMI